LTHIKRLGRYHNTSNTNSDDSSTRSYIDHLASSSYKDTSCKSSINLNKPLFGYKRTSLQKVLENAKKTTERATKFINKIKSRQLAYANRVKSIPKNATIRKEYIKCGKEICELRHGPYYYAYWKDAESKKLKKKYIGHQYSEE
jgi:hypothetical protein